MPRYTLWLAGAERIAGDEDAAVGAGLQGDWYGHPLRLHCRVDGPVRRCALSVDGDDVVVAHVSEQCDGLTVTRYAMTGDEQSQDARCVDVADPDAPAAIAESGEEVIVWAGDTTASVTE